MARDLILETTFLVDLERELHAGAPGPAHDFLEQRADTRLFLTFTVAGELATGLAPDGRNRWEELLGPFEVLPATPDVCWEYGKAFRFLKANGLLIGANDLWIAATALAFDKAVVTRSVREYQRIPGLEVLSYQAPAA